MNAEKKTPRTKKSPEKIIRDLSDLKGLEIETQEYEIIVQNKEIETSPKLKNENKVMNKKRVIFVEQPKGGVGKSVLVYLGAEKNPDALVFDFDDSTKTTSKQLGYRNPQLISFLDDEGKIDRAIFDNFFEKVDKGFNTGHS